MIYFMTLYILAASRNILSIPLLSAFLNYAFCSIKFASFPLTPIYVKAFPFLIYRLNYFILYFSLITHRFKHIPFMIFINIFEAKIFIYLLFSSMHILSLNLFKIFLNFARIQKCVCFFL